MAEAVTVTIERLAHGADLPLPAYATPGASGLDLLAAAEAVIEPGRWAAVPTGIRIALPTGTEAQVRPRSGLAARHGLTVLNAPGTIDADYRGEIKVLLVNHGCEPFRVSRGMRIAQLVLAPVLGGRWREVAIDPEGTGRGEGGFGSTGTGREGQPC
ncbi:MAG TPA: dUTP diphosphatase [Geminicoccaceae bacterium]|nr:dUTP diphosphatase [Geminicoccus sp.]HMU52692.1 dUTP diphosphatase [Geminicoccaceae bacterium]